MITVLQALKEAEYRLRDVPDPRLDAEWLLSDCGLPPDHPNRGRFRFALANPPYYGEGRIADLFAEIAAASLAPGGVCWMVAKTPDIIRAACEKCFSTVEPLKRRGYTVLKASGVIGG